MRHPHKRSGRLSRRARQKIERARRAAYEARVAYARAERERRLNAEVELVRYTIEELNAPSPLWQVIAVMALVGAVVWAWMLEMRVWP